MIASRNAAPHPDAMPTPPKGSGWIRRIVIALAVTGVVGVALAIALGFFAIRFLGGVADSLQSVDVKALERMLSDTALELDKRQREVIGPLLDRLKNPDLAPREREAAGEAIMAELGPGQRERIEIWREEGIRRASELSGLPLGFFRWVEAQGVPVGEFMRFLMPFLDWVEMVGGENGTHAPGPKSQPRENTI